MEFIVCDLETTGFAPDKDKIIEIAMARVVNGEIMETFTSLVNPQCGIPLKVKRLTGINEQELASSPTLEELLGDLEKFLIPAPLVGHNIAFDHSFLEANLGLLPYTACLDTLELSRIILPDVPGHSLTALAGHLGLADRELHRALDDVLTTIDLYLALAGKLELLNMEVMLQLLPLLRQGQSPWIQVINHLTRDRIRNFSDAKITGRVPVKDPVRPPKPPRANQWTDPERESESTIEYLLGPQSPLTGLLPNYEQRREQINMASAVDTTLAEKKILLVEAGTGTGKSLAYLLPALLWSLRLDQRAVIATNTINLQEQLWHKDIPLLQKMLPVPFQAALLKGRSNYLCLRRFFHLAGSVSALTPAEAKLAARILVWLQHTDSGDRAELNLYGQDNETWLQICSESESCPGGACRWYHRYCFVARARRNAESSQLLIINHALLFTDMTAEMKLLPPHDILIIDEAHHIEATATMHLGKKVSRSEIGQWLSLAGRIFKKLKETAPPRNGNKWSGALIEAEKNRYELQQSANTFFNCLASVCAELTNQGHNNRFRLHREPDLLPLVDAEWQNFLYRLRGFITGGLKTLHTLLEEWTAAGEPWEEKLQDVMLVSGRGAGYLSDLLLIMAEPAANYVHWLELFRISNRQDYVNCTLHATPVDVSKLLYEQLFNTSRSIVLTSATMTVNGNFEHFMNRCGLDLLPGGQVQTGIMDSPFDYQNQCLLYIPEKMPLPSETSTEDYMDTLVDIIYTLAEETGGRTLVLFTSHKLLRDVYHRVKPRFEESGICLLGHNLDGGRGRLVDEFIKDGRSVLFGSSSFWEGVDIPGDDLVNVIIVKLPFAPPNDPIQAARQEIIASRGQNAFYSLSLPQAVIRFKQGFGRLIRSKRDRGTVVVLDRRVIEKRYGRVFLNSLPVRTHLRDELAVFRKKLAEWIR